jgi:hypothetical protein
MAPNTRSESSAFGVPDHQLDTERLGARAEHLDRLQEAAVADEELRRPGGHRCALPAPGGHHHRFGAVASSNGDAVATCIPGSPTIVWKLSSPSRRPQDPSA